MDPLSKKRFMINFDLDTKLTKEEFGKKGTSPAYTAIKKYLEANGFEHRQYSGYISCEPMIEANVYSIIEEMYQKYTWLYRCAQHTDISEIGQRYDLHTTLCDKYKGGLRDPETEKEVKSLSNRVNEVMERSNSRDSYEHRQDIRRNDPVL